MKQLCLIDIDDLRSTVAGLKQVIGDTSGLTIYGVLNSAKNVINASKQAKKVQVYNGYGTVNSSSYTDTSVSLTVEKDGVYNISWMGFSNRNGSNGSQLYINNTAYGSPTTSMINSYGHRVSLTGVTLKQGDVLTIRARSYSTSNTMSVGHLIIEEV